MKSLVRVAAGGEGGAVLFGGMNVQWKTWTTAQSPIATQMSRWRDGLITPKLIPKIVKNGVTFKIQDLLRIRTGGTSTAVPICPAALLCHSDISAR